MCKVIMALLIFMSSAGGSFHEGRLPLRVESHSTFYSPIKKNEILSFAENGCN